MGTVQVVWTSWDRCAACGTAQWNEWSNGHLDKVEMPTFLYYEHLRLGSQMPAYFGKQRTRW